MKLTLAQKTFASKTFRSAALAGSTTARGPYRLAAAQAASAGATIGAFSHRGSAAGQAHA
ncbi:MAG: hypothetical protein ABFC96_07735 [Thermoguttaceae bacterium]